MSIWTQRVCLFFLFVFAWRGAVLHLVWFFWFVKPSTLPLVIHLFLLFSVGISEDTCRLGLMPAGNLGLSGQSVALLFGDLAVQGLTA